MGENENYDVKMYIAEPDGSYTPINQIQNLNIAYTDNNIFPYISTIDERSKYINEMYTSGRP